MAAVAQNDITAYKGENLRITFSMSPAESIAGWTIVLSLKRTYDDTSVLFQVTATHTNDGTGVYYFDVGPADFTQTVGRYVYDVQRTDTGSVGVLSIGAFVVRKEVRT